MGRLVRLVRHDVAMTYGFTGLDVVERRHRYLIPEDAADVLPDDPQILVLDDDTVSYALLVEMQRPPWWRKLDAEKKARAKELA